MNPFMNPMVMGSPMMGRMPGNPMQVMRPPMGGNQRMPIDRDKMKQYMGSIDDVQLNNLAAQARQQGISDADIEAGLSFLRRLGK